MNFRNHIEKIIIGIVLAFFVIIGIYNMSKGSGSEIVNTKPITKLSGNHQANENDSSKPITEIVIHIDGEVAKPGILKMPNGSRLSDAIRQAGGLTKNADTKQINLALKLADEMKIIIPKIGEESSQGSSNNLSSTSSVNNPSGEKIDINNCTKEDLMKLPGIGASKADKIIQHRESTKFVKIEDIMDVSGIGEKTFESIKGNIIVK